MANEFTKHLVQRVNVPCIVLALGFAWSLGACSDTGGDGPKGGNAGAANGGTGGTSGAGAGKGGAGNSTSGSLPLAVTAKVSYTAKQLHWDWKAAAGASHYRLMENAGEGVFQPVGGNVTSTSTVMDVSVHRLNWDKARYRVDACNAQGCTPGAEISVQDGAVLATGYFKATVPQSGAVFGLALSLSTDGKWLAVGAPTQQDGGAVYLFSRSATGAWVAQGIVKGSNTRGYDSFGVSVALSADGSTLAVGANFEDGAATGVNGNKDNDCTANPNACAEDSGAAYIFTRSGNTWSEQAYIKASNTESGDAFGASVALSADGSTFAVGATYENSASAGIDGQQTEDCKAKPTTNCAISSGAVYVFTREAAAWGQQAYVKASNPGESDYFGTSLAFSADGNTLAVGAWEEDGGATGINNDQNDTAPDSGAVYVFTRKATAWSQQAYIKSSNSEGGDKLGRSIALSADGNTLAAGAYWEDSAATGIGGDQTDDCRDTQTHCSANSGAAYVFTREAGLWVQNAYIKASNTGESDGFGWGVALSANGNTLAVGAAGEASIATGVNGIQDDDSALSSGAVYLFTRGATAWKQQAYVKASNTRAFTAFGLDLALDADGSTLAVGSIWEASSSPTDQKDLDAMQSGAVYLF